MALHTSGIILAHSLNIYQVNIAVGLFVRRNQALVPKGASGGSDKMGGGN